LHSRDNPITICGVTFDNLSRPETIAMMESFIREGGPHMICTPNADHIIKVRQDPEFRRIIENADLVVSDGLAVVYASRLLGTPFKEWVGGRHLLPAMAELSAKKGYRLFLLGGSSPHVAATAVARLQERYPGIKIAGFYSPPHMPEFDEPETSRMLHKINQSRPDVLFVCLGTPKQEKWIARNLKRLEAPVAVGVGVALDMLAGEVRQPPAWMTRSGLEWLWRTLQDPIRLGKRYVIDDSLFIGLVLQQKLRKIGTNPIRPQQ
jgi:N-acetylglucosaminyldiphosphoundecaprenol N-acetyl-beta-D-mannosaminyltransferase